MNFMEKFNELANRTLVPIANKLGNQRHLAAIRDGMVVAIPLSILGANYIKFKWFYEKVWKYLKIWIFS